MESAKRRRPSLRGAAKRPHSEQRERLSKMPNGADLEQKQREEARWRILRVLDAGRPIGVNETIVWRVLHDVKIGLSLMQVRRELEYLKDLGLARLEDVGTETWSAKLTALGVDVAEYTVDSPPGIARPKKYW
jgi:hypothetical protein